MTERELELIEKVGTPFHDALARSIRLWTPIQKRIFGNAGCNMNDDNVAFLHDPLAVACLYDPTCCTFESLQIETELVGGILRTFDRLGSGENTSSIACATK